LRRVTSPVLKRFLRRWPVVASVVIAMAMLGACTGEEFADEADFVMDELERTGTIAQPTEFEGQVLIYAEDVPTLLAEVRSKDTQSDQKVVIRDYLKKQDKINCILEGIEEAVEDEASVKCSSHELVEKNDAAQILEDIHSQGSELAARQFVGSYVSQWTVDQRLDSVMEGLSQIKNTEAIPLFGPILDKMHDFPILFEGTVLVPKKDIPGLLKQYSDLDTKEDRQELVIDYLSQAIP
jgi:hypothetical protein